MIKLAHPDIGDEELNAIKQVLDSGYLVQGKMVEELETLVADYLGVKYAIAVSSGTAALHLAVKVLDLKTSDEVIVPDFTFPATANVVELVGAKTKLVDVELNTFCIDPSKIERYINENTKAIIPVHEFGCSAKLNNIMTLAEKYNLRVIEDAACALGTEYKGKKVGTFGDVGCFSLHPRKAITTGEGGIVVTNDDSIARKVKILRNHGIDNSEGFIDFIEAGFNYRMTDIQAAMGVVQLRKLDNILARRKKCANIYNKLLASNKFVTLPNDMENGRHIFQTFHILLDKKIDRNKVMLDLRKAGIESNIGAYAVHKQTYYNNKYHCSDNDYKCSTFCYEHGLALPLHNELDEEIIGFICNQLNRILMINQTKGLPGVSAN